VRVLPIVFAAALAAAPGVVAAQGVKGAEAKPSSELHRIMMRSAKESQSMKPTGDVDHDFVTMMRHHHKSGIEMAEVAIKNGKDPEVREMARKIVEGQQKELAELGRLAKSHPPSSAGASARSKK
jgi:uncharacterized protein (DUF305 family)